MLDHNVVYVVRTYKLDLKRIKVENQGQSRQNKDLFGLRCFQKCMDLHKLTETMTAYISFC